MNSKQNDLFSRLTPARLARVCFLPTPMSWHSSSLPSFHPPIQFNTSLFSYGFVPVLGPGDTETQRKWLCLQELIV